jgi:DNA polymerase-1
MDEMNQHAVIVDFSHLFHLSFAAACNAPESYDLKSVTIENVIGKLRTVRRKLKELHITAYDLVFVEDRPAFRKLKALPGYRAGRVNRSQEKQEIKSYLLDNGHITRFCYSEGNEADDAIASVVKLALQYPEMNVIIVSGDRDLWQLIQPRVRVYNPIKQEFVKSIDVARAFEWRGCPSFLCEPKYIPIIKTLWGDAGDCVPNLLPRTQKELLPIIEHTDGSLESFWSRINNGDKFYLTERCYDSLLEHESEIQRNWEIVKLDDQCKLEWE